MAEKRAWTTYPQTYRASELERIANWILAGESGSVVGMTGSGKSNLLGFLCHQPDIVQSFLPEGGLKIALVQVDLNDLPDNDLGTFYRVILRSLFEAQLVNLEPGLASNIESLYRKVEDKADAFLAQGTLREALFLFQEKNVRLVLVLDPFDEFCRTAPLQVLDNLRGMRDSFKSTLSYIVGSASELAYLRDPQEMGKLYSILDEHLCWLGAMVDQDARWVISQVASATYHTFSETEIESLIEVTGGYPSLLKAVSTWLVRNTLAPDRDDWIAALLAERSLQHRLESIWVALSQEEQMVLSELQKLQGRLATKKDRNKRAGAARSQSLDKALEGLAQQHQAILERLAAKGFCRAAGSGWRIRSDLLARFVANVEGRGGSKIWLDEESEILYFGQSPIEELAPLERSVLSFLVKNPKLRHTKTDLIINTWPDELRRQGVTDQSLYQVILDLRKKIEPNWTKPTYLVTWRGKPEGGYQFFPEGKPG